MSRIHLFEFEDQKWFPTMLRNFGTDFLQFLANKTKMYHPIVDLLSETLNEENQFRIIDLGSGGGGGLIGLNEELKKKKPDLKILLTDFYPNVPAFEFTKSKATNFDYVRNPIDARNVPEKLIGVRTQFLSLHHFRPEDAVKILQNAVDVNQSIAIFEAQERSFASILAMLFSPITVLLTTPFIRPFKIERIIFTYLIPIIPLFILWDGVVSSLRTYSVKEMKELVEKVNGNEKYDWNIGRIKSGPSVVLHLIGKPKK